MTVLTKKRAQLRTLFFMVVDANTFGYGLATLLAGMLGVGALGYVLQRRRMR